MTGPLTNSEAITSGVCVLTCASTVAVNAQLGGHFRLLLTGNPAIASPSNPVDGQKITFELIQDSSGSRVPSWGPAYNFGRLGIPVLTTAPGKRDLAGFVYSADEGCWMFAGMMPGF
jgi:hypothetical protein